METFGKPCSGGRSPSQPLPVLEAVLLPAARTQPRPLSVHGGALGHRDPSICSAVLPSDALAFGVPCLVPKKLGLGHANRILALSLLKFMLLGLASDFILRGPLRFLVCSASEFAAHGHPRPPLMRKACELCPYAGGTWHEPPSSLPNLWLGSLTLSPPAVMDSGTATSIHLHTLWSFLLKAVWMKVEQALSQVLGPGQGFFNYKIVGLNKTEAYYPFLFY